MLSDDEVNQRIAMFNQAIEGIAQVAESLCTGYEFESSRASENNDPRIIAEAIGGMDVIFESLKKFNAILQEADPRIQRMSKGMIDLSNQVQNSISLQEQSLKTLIADLPEDEKSMIWEYR